MRHQNETVQRYEFTTPRLGDPAQMRRLQRAIARFDLAASGASRSLEIIGSESPCVVVLVTGRPAAGAREARRVFQEVWYDAFGERDGPMT